MYHSDKQVHVTASQKKIDFLKSFSRPASRHLLTGALKESYSEKFPKFPIKRGENVLLGQIYMPTSLNVHKKIPEHVLSYETVKSFQKIYSSEDI